MKMFILKGSGIKDTPVFYMLVAFFILSLGVSCLSSFDRVVPSPLQTESERTASTLKDSRCKSLGDALMETEEIRGYKVAKIPRIRSAGSIFFLDQDRGWAGGQNELWMTVDGGANWRLISRPINDEYFIDFIHFTTQTRGTIILQTRTKRRFETKMEVLDTVNGGISWHRVYSGGGVVVTDFKVDAELGSGWITGLRYEETVGKISNFVLSKNGTVCLEITGTLRETVNESNEGSMAIGKLLGGRVTVITSSGRIFESTDSAGTWKLVDEYPTRHLRINSAISDSGGNIWVLGGIRTDENSYSNLFFFPHERRDESCIRVVSLQGVFLKGLAVSHEGLFAFGGRDSKIKGKFNIGTILISKNQGADWATIFKDEGTSEFVASTGNHNFLYFLNAAGLIIKVHTP